MRPERFRFDVGARYSWYQSQACYGKKEDRTPYTRSQSKQPQGLRQFPYSEDLDVFSACCR